MALNGSNGKFLSSNKDDEIVCLSSKAGDQEMIKVSFDKHADPILYLKIYCQIDILVGILQFVSFDDAIFKNIFSLFI